MRYSWILMLVGFFVSQPPAVAGGDRDVVEWAIDLALSRAGLDPDSAEADLAKRLGRETFDPLATEEEVREAIDHIVEHATGGEYVRGLSTARSSERGDGQVASVRRHLGRALSACGCACCRDVNTALQAAAMILVIDLDSCAPIAGVPVAYSTCWEVKGYTPVRLERHETRTDECGLAIIPILEREGTFAIPWEFSIGVSGTEYAVKAPNVGLPGGLFGRWYVGAPSRADVARLPFVVERYGRDFLGALDRHQAGVRAGTPSAPAPAPRSGICARCQGRGQVHCGNCDGKTYKAVQVTCETCDGTGECPQCRGTEKVPCGCGGRQQGGTACPRCEGTGQQACPRLGRSHRCGSCNGRAYHMASENCYECKLGWITCPDCGGR